MVRLALSILVQLIANAIGLVVAASVLDDMTLDVSAFFVAVGLFTLVNVLVLPMLQRNAIRQNSAISGSTALVAAFIALVVTVIATDGLTIDGLSTWIVATIIVWGGALIGTLLLPVLVFKRLREDEGRR